MAVLSKAVLSSCVHVRILELTDGYPNKLKWVADSEMTRHEPIHDSVIIVGRGLRGGGFFRSKPALGVCSVKFLILVPRIRSLCFLSCFISPSLSKKIKNKKIAEL